MVSTITRKEIKDALVNKELTLIEALPEKYYNDGHLPGALQMNYDEVEEKASLLLPEKNAAIVTYCASDTCPNSEYLAKALIAEGYTNVRKYSGGKKDWSDANNKLET